MCGFTGFSEGKAASQRVIRAMTDLIVHRGPDDEGFFIDGGTAMGFRRLSLVDMEHGHQPMLSEDGSFALVFNGEIYNHRELRAGLQARGRVFSTDSDTEVLLRLFEEYGPAMLPMLRGMFAFVIHDRQNKALFGARDPFGIKPLYYYENRGALLFGSEIKSFLAHPSFDKKLNIKRLPEYLCFEYVPSSETMFEGVFSLPGGHCFAYKDGKLGIKPYHEFEYKIDDSKTMEDWKNAIGEAFRDSCKAHMEADAEVGAFLSSGVDSSLVVREVSKSVPVKTFSVGYREEKYSELANASELAGAIGVENHPVKISAEDFFAAAPLVQYHMDEPLPNPSAIPLYYLSKHAAGQVKAVLSGEGSDELFGGYVFYRECLSHMRYRRLTPKPMRALLAGLAGRLPRFRGRRYLIRGNMPIEKRYVRNTYVFSEIERADILKEDFGSLPPEAWSKPYFDKVKDLDDITKMQYADIHLWMGRDILLKADKMSMAHSLEVRTPFLDREVLKVALGIPHRFRVGKKATKLALREYARGELPQKSAQMKKLGFPVPLSDWLRQEKYYDMVLKVFESEPAGRFFNKDAILKLLNDHREGRALNMKKIWSIYCFLLWYDEYFVKR